LGQLREVREHAPLVVGDGLAVAARVRTEAEVLADAQLGQRPAALGHMGDP
jgi:hypothetical protein